MLYTQQYSQSLLDISPTSQIAVSQVADWLTHRLVKNSSTASGVARQQGLGVNQGVWGRKSPSGAQGRSPGGGLRASPPEAEEKSAK